jgi:hypothetical protein
MPGLGRASAGTIGVAVFIEFESFSSFCWADHIGGRNRSRALGSARR